MRTRSLCWYYANRERSIATAKAWQKRNPARLKARAIVRRTQKRYPEFVCTGADYNDLIVWISETLGTPCIYCGEPCTEIDHILPFSSGCHPLDSNLQGLCAFCNNAKFDWSEEEFKRKIKLIGERINGIG